MVEHPVGGLVATLWQRDSLGRNYYQSIPPNTIITSITHGLQPIWYPRSLYLSSVTTTKIHLFQKHRYAIINKLSFRNTQDRTFRSCIGWHTLTMCLPEATLPKIYSIQENMPLATPVFSVLLDDNFVAISLVWIDVSDVYFDYLWSTPMKTERNDTATISIGESLKQKPSKCQFLIFCEFII